MVKDIFQNDFEHDKNDFSNFKITHKHELRLYDAVLKLLVCRKTM